MIKESKGLYVAERWKLKSKNSVLRRYYSEWEKSSRLHLYKVASRKKYVTWMVQVGVGNGAETRLLVEATKTGVIYAVDKWKDQRKYSCFLAVCGRKMLANRIKGRKKAPEEFIKTWQRSIDILIIGISDSKASIENRIRSWIPFVRKRGLVVIAGYAPENRVLSDMIEEIAFPQMLDIKRVGNVLFGKRK